MLKLNLFHQPEIQDEHIDIYYSSIKPTIQKIVDIVKSEQHNLWGKYEGEKVPLNFDDILYIESVDKKSFAYLLKQVYEIEGTLAELEDWLSDYGFVRISKSHIVNVYRITMLKPEVNMKVCATFENGEKIYINRSYKKSFHDFLLKVKASCIL